MYTTKISKLKTEYERACILREQELSLPEQERNSEVIGYYTAALHYLPQLITIYTLYRDLSNNNLPKPIKELDTLYEKVVNNKAFKKNLGIPDSIHIEDTSYRAYRPDPALVFEEPNYYKP